jgi:predicted RNA binding protein YcfA (HicA-like mRNA interferase family)
MYDTPNVKGSEFIRMIRRLGKQRGVEVYFAPHQGKGSHGRIYFGDRFTTIKDTRKELGQGLLAAMLKQLGLSQNDLD